MKKLLLITCTLSLFALACKKSTPIEPVTPLPIIVDTIPLDTIPVDTIPIDTVPIDTIIDTVVVLCDTCVSVTWDVNGVSNSGTYFFTQMYMGNYTTGIKDSITGYELDMWHSDFLNRVDSFGTISYSTPPDSNEASIWSYQGGVSAYTQYCSQAGNSFITVTSIDTVTHRFSGIFQARCCDGGGIYTYDITNGIIKNLKYQ